MTKTFYLKRGRLVFSCQLLICLLSVSLYAQDVLISGVITDGQQPIPGASILIKHTVRGTVSDFDGRYELPAKPTDTLQISYLGYSPMELPVGSLRVINVILQEDATALGEVTINAGYYNTTERTKTGSIAQITAKEIAKQPVSNPLAAMQGRLSGVNIVETSGVPGSGFDVRIRGQSSLMAGNEPLYIIDGVPYDSQTLGSSNTSGPIIPNANISPLNAINPATIESIEVLKDADATAIYGSRGANGVVLISTKKGQQGQTTFIINSRTGFSTIAQKRDVLNTEQYLEMRREAFANDGISTYPATAYDVNGTWDENRYTDWQEALIGETATTRQFMASVSGGGERTQFLLSGMYQNETTVFPKDFNYDRITFNSNIRHTSINNRFRLNFSAGYTAEANLLPGMDLSNDAYTLSPNAPALYDDTGELNWENNTWTNPLAQLDTEYQQDSKNLISNLVLTYDVIKDLEVKVSTGYGFSNLSDYQASPHTVFNPAYGLDSSSSTLITSESARQHYIIEPQLNWKRRFANHSIQILLGSTFQEQQTDRTGFLGFGFANNHFITNLSAASTLMVLEADETTYRHHSIFSRLHYAYKNTFLLNLTGRRDGSSRFGSGNKYGNFGAIGAAYLFSNDLQWSWLNHGKLRGSYGLTGNDQIGDYQYLQTFTITDSTYDGYLGLEPSRLYNPVFQWEESIKKEIALELGAFADRLSFSAAYYNHRSSNQLINYALPGTTGFTSILSNLDALVENSGWEFEMHGAILNKGPLKWEASLNLTLPKNKLLAFPGLEDSTYANRYIIGEPVSIVKLYQLQGVNPETGLFEFEDFNGDGQITSLEDRQQVADLTPQLYGGFGNVVTYKNWALDVFFQFEKKDGYNAYRYSQSPGRMLNQPVDVLDRWQQPGDHAAMQRFTTGADGDAARAYTRFTQSTGVISDASFIRLKSLELAYSIPNKKGSESCRIALQGQNLLTFTHLKGVDPEQVTRFIPVLKRVNLTVQFQF